MCTVRAQCNYFAVRALSTHHLSQLWNKILMCSPTIANSPIACKSLYIYPLMGVAWCEVHAVQKLVCIDGTLHIPRFFPYIMLSPFENFIAMLSLKIFVGWAEHSRETSFMFLHVAAQAMDIAMHSYEECGYESGT